jgi:starch synthase
MPPKRICFVTSEIIPFSKTGGLADVSGALPKYLRRAGHDVRVFTPFYSTIELAGHELEPVEEVRNAPIVLGRRTFVFSLFRTTHAEGAFPVHFVQCPALYDRRGIYTPDPDEHLRFILLSRACLESCRRLGWSPDIVHCNDWPTALTPVYLKSLYVRDPLFSRAKSVLTIHNLGYQGLFPAEVLDDTGLSRTPYLFPREDLAAGRVGFLKAGLIHADYLATVSPTYAREIQNEDVGMGLHGLLRSRARKLVGILNGVDTEKWNPSTDRFLDFRYSVKSLWRKEKNKETLLSTLRLPYSKHVPVIGMVTRLAYQKGIDLLLEPLPELLASRDVRLLVLASGETKYEEFFADLERRAPQKTVFHRGHHEEFAHKIEGAADIFLMPSIYEPCGLNQMYSLLYGTVPVVRKTGGLADTVKLYNPGTGEGNGIVFDHPTPQGVRWALDTALKLYENRQAWRGLMSRGMGSNFSWEAPAARYGELYDLALDGDRAKG